MSLKEIRERDRDYQIIYNDPDVKGRLEYVSPTVALQAFRDRAELLALLNRQWIKVSERLPEEARWCLTYGGPHMIDLAIFSPTRKCFCDPDSIPFRPTHWQPLPPPPTD